MEDEQELVKEGEQERLLIMPFSFYVPAKSRSMLWIAIKGYTRPWDITSHYHCQSIRVKGCMWALMN